MDCGSGTGVIVIFDDSFEIPPYLMISLRFLQISSANSHVNVTKRTSRSTDK